MKPDPKRKGRRALGLALSVAAHVGVLAVVLSAAPQPIRQAEPELMPVDLVPPRLVPPREPPPAPTPKPEAAPSPPKPAPITPPPRLKVRAPKAAPPEVVPLRAAVGPPGPPADQVSEAELAGAATAGSGGGAGAGAGCDMAAWLQGRLRADARVQAAIAAAHPGRPLLVWNGDWVRRTDQDGAGLAQVRESIMWEVGFAPAACRAAPMRGLVVLALSDGPQPARLVLGRPAWRWSDLLHAHGRAAG